MKKLVIITMCLLLVIPAIGQRSIRLLEAADELFNNQEYTNAVEAYDKILRRDRSPEVRKEVSFKMGESYRKLLNYSEAWKWYTVSMNVGYEDPIIYLHLSEMGLGLEDFDNAIYFARKYLQNQPGNQHGEKVLESALFSKENYFLKSLIEVTNEYGINSSGQEWGVGFFENIAMFQNDPEKRASQYDVEIQLKHNSIIYWALRSERLKERIVFASTKNESGRLDARTGTGFSNIYEATYSRRNNKWDSPTLLQNEINSDHYEGFFSFNEKNLTAYYMNCGGYRGTRSTCDIYTATFDTENEQWTTPAIFPFNSDEFNIGYPSVSEDGDILYFASDMPGGYGGYDLYKIEKDLYSDNWGQPKNLGSTVNTELNDAYPFIAGNILYFSSFGHPGFGGFDIFYSEIDDNGNYSQPENMGAPINSSADDFSFIINNEYTRGYFTSNRPGGFGDDDIYSFWLNHDTFILNGQITDNRTLEPLPGMELFVYGDDGSIHTFTTDPQGFYQGELYPEVNYQIEMFHPDYYPYYESFSVKEKLIASRFLEITEFEKDIDLLPLAPLLLEDDYVEDKGTEEITFAVRPDITGDRSSLPVIYFDFGQQTLNKAAIQQSNIVLSYLNDNPDVGIIVHGHTDEVSGYLFNFYLSQRRAQSIIDYLVSKGADQQRLFAFGHGKMELAVKNAKSNEEHQLNRRGDFETIPMEGYSQFVKMAPRHSFRYLNSLTKQAHYAQGIEFMVQFAATKNPVHPRYYRRIMDAIPDLDIIYYYDIDRYHRYSLGSFRDLNSTLTIHHKLRELGYDTYIVAFRDGERISIAEANRVLSNR